MGKSYVAQKPPLPSPKYPMKCREIKEKEENLFSLLIEILLKAHKESALDNGDSFEQSDFPSPSSEQLTPLIQSRHVCDARE